jgi:hypothetical protein
MPLSRGLFGEFFSQMSVISSKNRQFSMLKKYWKILSAGDISIFMDGTLCNKGCRR